MNEPTILTERAREKSSYQIIGQIVAPEFPAGIPLSVLTAFTISLYSLEGAAAIINGLDNANALNTGRGVVDNAGNFIIRLLPADNPIVNDTLPEEIHRLQLAFTYNGGADIGRHRVEFFVTNFERVT